MRKTAFITGASSGIGAATAKALAVHGHDLVLVARREDRLRGLAAEVEKTHGVAVRLLPLDVRDAAGWEAARASRPDLFDPVDVLVNNAGLALGTEPLHEGNPDEWDVVLDTNVKALLRVTRSLLPGMLRRGRGHVVNLGSTAGHWVYPGGAVYCASKHAVRALTEGLRMDIHGSGVRVTSIDPGLVETEFSQVRFRGDRARAEGVYAGMTPLTPEDVAEAIAWCVSRPAHVNVQDVVLMPTDQASVTLVKRRT